MFGRLASSQMCGSGYEVGENAFLLVEDRDIELARSERPPPGTVEVSEPAPGPRRQCSLACTGKTMKKPPPPMMMSRRSRRARGCARPIGPAEKKSYVTTPC